MIVDPKVKIDIDTELDAAYINFINAPIDARDQIDTEELEDGIFRTYNENKSYITYRYAILDFSYNDKEHLSKLTGIDLTKV